MAIPRLQYLVQQVLAQQATEAEWQEFHAFVLQAREQPELQEVLEQQWHQFRPVEEVPAPQLAALYNTIIQTPARQPAARTIHIWYRWMAAAAVILVLLGAAYLWIYRAAPGKREQARLAVDIAPGGNKAVLTLADGRKIILDSSANGMLAQVSGAKVVKTADGEITYRPESTGRSTALSYNTMSTPRGGQYHLVLPDGSNVWLNAASSITYPTAFTAKNRTVTITGEAYFEVAPNASKPFMVHFANETLEVLGTNFNINSYTDEEALKATLLQGKVKVQSTILNPGEQAVITKDARLSIDNNVNIDKVMAWKNGLFDFDNADLPTVLRQLERWYDINVQYKGKIPAFSFKGKLQRNLNLSQVLRILDEMEVQYEVKGRTLIVTP